MTRESWMIKGPVGSVWIEREPEESGGWVVRITDLKGGLINAERCATYAESRDLMARQLRKGLELLVARTPEGRERVDRPTGPLVRIGRDG